MAKAIHPLDMPILPGEFTDEVSPEAAEKLFKAIVLVSLKDACGEPPDIVGDMPDGWLPSARSKADMIEDAWATFAKGRIDKRKDAIRDRDEARKWLLTGGRDFEMICNAAGWEPDYIRGGARRLDGIDWPYRAVNAMEEALAA